MPSPAARCVGRLRRCRGGRRQSCSRRMGSPVQVRASSVRNGRSLRQRRLARWPTKWPGDRRRVCRRRRRARDATRGGRCSRFPAESPPGGEQAYLRYDALLYPSPFDMICTDSGPIWLLSEAFLQLSKATRSSGEARRRTRSFSHATSFVFVASFGLDKSSRFRRLSRL